MLDIEEMNMLASPTDTAEQTSYLLWGQIVTTTKAFGVVELDVHPRICLIIARVTLRWWAKSKRLEWFRNYWLRKAEMRVRDFTPKGWRILIRYERRNS